MRPPGSESAPRCLAAASRRSCASPIGENATAIVEPPRRSRHLRADPQLLDLRLPDAA